MSEAAVKERFGDEVAKEIPYDSTPEDLKRADRNAQTDAKQQACVVELWDKEAGIACWFSKSMKKFLDEKEDPLKLQQFFPCPKPLFATLTNDQLVPVPDFTLYQDQAQALDVIADRASGLVRMLQVKGVYDASADSSLSRLFTEGSNGNLLPVKNWAAFAEKNGLKGQVDVFDLTPVANALQVCYEAAEQQKQQIYEIMGIPDIVRGSSNPSETLGAQEMKGEFASMRLNAMKSDVARFATDILQIKAQIICSKFNPRTIIAIGAAEQLSEMDKRYVPPAMELLIGPERLQNPEAESPNPMRAFRIEVNADSMVQMNEAAEKKDRMEFLVANGQFMKQASEMAASAGAAAPILVPLIMEMWKFGVTGFRVGKTIEGAFDEAAEKFKQMALNPQPPKPDPEMMKVQAQQQSEQARLQHDQQVADRQAAHEQQVAQEQAMHAQAEAGAKMQLEEQKIEAEDRRSLREDEFNRWKVEQENKTKIEVAEIAAGAAIDAAQMKQAEDAVDGKPAKDGKDGKPKRKGVIDKLAEMHAQTMEAHGKMVEAMSKPKRIVRGPDGRAAGVETVQ
jgi:hypothetical protein